MRQNNINNSTLHRVSVQGVKSLGGHFACLCRGFEFFEVKKKFVIIFQRKSKIAQIYYYDPQSAGINVQSHQSESTPRRLTLAHHILFDGNNSKLPKRSTCKNTAFSRMGPIAGELTKRSQELWLTPTSWTVIKTQQLSRLSA